MFHDFVIFLREGGANAQLSCFFDHIFVIEGVGLISNAA
jgi:hypothetical protein